MLRNALLGDTTVYCFFCTFFSEIRAYYCVFLFCLKGTTPPKSAEKIRDPPPPFCWSIMMVVVEGVIGAMVWLVMRAVTHVSGQHSILRQILLRQRLIQSSST